MRQKSARPSHRAASTLRLLAASPPVIRQACLCREPPPPGVPNFHTGQRASEGTPIPPTVRLRTDGPVLPGRLSAGHRLRPDVRLPTAARFRAATERCCAKSVLKNDDCASCCRLPDEDFWWNAALRGLEDMLFLRSGCGCSAERRQRPLFTGHSVNGSAPCKDSAAGVRHLPPRAPFAGCKGKSRAFPTRQQGARRFQGPPGPSNKHASQPFLVRRGAD